jgi:hypothetical protein
VQYDFDSDDERGLYQDIATAVRNSLRHRGRSAVAGIAALAMTLPTPTRSDRTLEVRK